MQQLMILKLLNIKIKKIKKKELKLFSAFFFYINEKYIRNFDEKLQNHLQFEVSLTLYLLE